MEKPIETTHLSSLVALFQFQSYSRAAEELGITQSAVSQNIKRLEARVNATLVHKTAKGLSLTVEGLALVEVAKKFFTELDETLGQIHSDQRDFKGLVKLGSLFGLGQFWLYPRIMPLFHSDLHSDHFTLKLILDFPKDLIDQFEKYQLDLLLLPGPYVPAYCDAVSIGKERATLVIPKNFPCSPKEITAKKMQDLPLIFFQDKDTLFRTWCRKHFGHTLREITPKLIVNSFGLMLDAVARGIGAAVIPLHVLENFHGMSDQYQVFGKDFEVELEEVFLVAHQGHFQLKKIAYLKEMILQQPF